MDFKEFEKLFIEECKRNNINIEDINIEKFYNYMLGIIDWNDKINVAKNNSLKTNGSVSKHSAKPEHTPKIILSVPL